MVWPLRKVGSGIGGVGLVIVEATSVLKFHSDYNAENLVPLVEAIHQGGALAAIQLFPGVLGQTVSPTQMTGQEIQQLIANYQAAAQVCADAGFDGIEPHGAHGYLLNKFFSPSQNQRTGDYGGDLAGRMCLALSIMETILPIARQADMLVLYRHTPVGPGYGIEESLTLAEELVKAGLDVLDISPASDSAPGDRAAPFMKFGLPVIAVNELDDLERSLEALREKRSDLVAVGRGLIADANWANKVREGRLDEIVTCIRCNECFDDLRQGKAVGCSQWDVS
ncbi:hypothetical protein ACFL6S_34745 [Candidatus Poribacteria bacterium]